MIMMTIEGDARTVECGTVHCSTVQYSTVQYSTVQYSTVRFNNDINGTYGQHSDDTIL